jgi:hypothetical protein
MASRLKKFNKYLKETANNGQKLVAQKPKQAAVILKYVAKQDIIKPANELVPTTSELIYERACMLACDMNLPLKWAEAAVKFRAIERPQSSWLEIKAACDQLYVDDFVLLKLIISNDWSLEDIYGCNKFAPFIRVDCMGLLLLLHQGDEVIGVNKERIKILKKSGSKVVFSKRLDQQKKVGMLDELGVNC